MSRPGENPNKQTPHSTEREEGPERPISQRQGRKWREDEPGSCPVGSGQEQGTRLGMSLDPSGHCITARIKNPRQGLEPIIPQGPGASFTLSAHSLSFLSSVSFVYPWSFPASSGFFQSGIELALTPTRMLDGKKRFTRKRLVYGNERRSMTLPHGRVRW